MTPRRFLSGAQLPAKDPDLDLGPFESRNWSPAMIYVCVEGTRKAKVYYVRLMGVNVNGEFGKSISRKYVTRRSV